MWGWEGKGILELGVSSGGSGVKVSLWISRESLDHASDKRLHHMPPFKFHPNSLPFKHFMGGCKKGPPPLHHHASPLPCSLFYSPYYFLGCRSDRHLGHNPPLNGPPNIYNWTSLWAVRPMKNETPTRPNRLCSKAYLSSKTLFYTMKGWIFHLDVSLDFIFYMYFRKPYIFLIQSAFFVINILFYFEFSQLPSICHSFKSRSSNLNSK